MSHATLWAAVIGRPQPAVVEWLERHEILYALFAHAYEPSIARNIAIHEFLRSGHSDVLMIDGDQVPTDDTRVLEAEGRPLTYCGYPSRNYPLQGHFGKGDFAAGCFRCTRDVILATQRELDLLNGQLARVRFPLPRPLELGWFSRPVRNYGADEHHCSCDWFNALALAAGFEAEMVGTIGHACGEGKVLVLNGDYTSFATGQKFLE